MNSSSLSIRQLWVTPNPSPDLVTKPIEERLLDLHNSLRGIHAGLWINTKPREGRYRSRSLGNTVAYLVVYHHNATSEQILEVVEGYGFSLVPEPERTPNLTVSTTRLAA
jgi:hypothetical protein